MKIKLIVTQTYNEKGKLDNNILEKKEVAIEDLPYELMCLAQRASDKKEDQELIIYFPEDDSSVMKVEIYNDLRE